jgi:hypothetical protein
LPRREVWLASGTPTQLGVLQRYRAQVSSICHGVRRTARANPPATPPPPVASAGVVQSRGVGGVDPQVASPSTDPLLANSSLLATGPTTSSMVQSGGAGETGEVLLSFSPPLSQMATAAPAVAPFSPYNHLFVVCLNSSSSPLFGHARMHIDRRASGFSKIAP